MMVCPNCRARLVSAKSDRGLLWACPTCGGRAVGMAVVRKAIAREYVDEIWQLAIEGKGQHGRPCATCRGPMTEVSPSGYGLTLDVCTTCHVMWFDPPEYEAAPPLPPWPEPERPLEARELVALMKVEAIAERARGQVISDFPDTWGEFSLALLGMPVEYPSSPLSRVPWLTWGLAAIITAVSVLAFFDLERAVRDFALVPAQIWRYGGLTLLTPFFLHGGIFHLVGNIYFLLIFGENVEDYLGKGRYLALVLLAALLGGLLHAALDPRRDIPVFGASGGISGLIVFYALRFRRARVGVLIWAFFRTLWLQVPVYVYASFWVLLQLIGAWQQVSGLTDVSSLGHLGGAAVGFLFWWIWRDG